MALVSAPDDSAAPNGCVLTAGASAVSVYAVGEWRLVRTEAGYGFVRRTAEGLTAIDEGDALDRTAAVLTEDRELITAEGGTVRLTAGTVLWATGIQNGFLRCVADGQEGYLRTGSGVKALADCSMLKLLASDAELDGYDVKTDKPLTLRAYPSSQYGETLGEIPAGEKLRVTAAARCWLRVTWNGLDGYVMGEASLLSEETTELPLSEDAPSYELVLDKNTKMLYAFVLDAEGNRTSEVAVCALVAIGKRTTPTPSGTFPLGHKERRHRFTNAFTPYTTEYTSGRYVHGLPTYVKSGEKGIDKVIPWLSKAAGLEVSGGCLRSPVAMARWVYLNCPSYTTRLVVVNGGVQAELSASTVDLSD